MRFDIITALVYRNLKTQHYYLAAELMHLLWSVDDRMEASDSTFVQRETQQLKNVLRSNVDVEEISDTVHSKMLQRSAVISSECSLKG